MSSPSINKDKLQALLAAHRLKQTILTAGVQVTNVGSTTLAGSKVNLHNLQKPDPNQILDKYGNTITLNSKQREFVDIACSGKSAVLIGAAGTGKSTCQRSFIERGINTGLFGILDTQDHKHLKSGTPGVVICAYTRRAVANIRKMLPADIQNNCITIHKLLEYEPVYSEVIDPISGDTKTKMSFEPKRTRNFPLPSSIRCIIFEEASMIGTDLHQEVLDACPHSPQEIYLGDIQQLPPVFGPAILGFKLLSLPVVELTDVYRQALESPIISLAHRILSGRGIPGTEFSSWKKPNQLTIHPWKKKIDPDAALNTAGMFFKGACDEGVYDPEEDMILIPFNKSFGTDELNKIIANHLSKKRNAETFQVVAGFNKHYFSIGDKVLYEKEDATVIAIEPTIGYTGAKAMPHSTTLDYWGFDPIKHDDIDTMDEDAMDFLLNQVASADSEDRVRQSSHTLHLRMNDSEVTVKLDKASEVNSLSLGYCLTVHKSQGSEWRKVFFVMHQSHATMLQRELLYTGVTRAGEELFIICEPETFINGIKSQRVKGDTLAEKAEFFKGKVNGERLV